MAKKEKDFSFLPLIIITIVLIVLIISGFFAFQKLSKNLNFQGNNQLQNQEQDKNIACSQEAKMCEDGSFISRTGPNCEFTECPTLDNKEKLCLDSGGSVVNIDCYCPGTADFYNTCAIGGCSCTSDPIFKRQIKICDCGGNRCFNDVSCVEK